MIACPTTTIENPSDPLAKTHLQNSWLSNVAFSSDYKYYFLSRWCLYFAYCLSLGSFDYFVYVYKLSSPITHKPSRIFE